MGEHLVIKDYNNKILENDNHIHLDTFLKIIGDLHGVLYLPKMSHYIVHTPWCLFMQKNLFSFIPFVFFFPKEEGRLSSEIFLFFRDRMKGNWGDLSFPSCLFGYNALFKILDFHNIVLIGLMHFDPSSNIPFHINLFKFSYGCFDQSHV